MKVFEASQLGLDESLICNEISDAVARHGQGLRNDSQGGTAISGGRAMWRAHLAQVAEASVQLKGMKAIPQARIDALGAQMGEAAGYSLGSDGWSHSIRNDAGSILEGELTDRNGVLKRPMQRSRALSETLPVRSVSSWAERYESRSMVISGRVAEYRPGTNDVPLADYSVGASKREIITLVAKTRTDFLGAMQGSNSSIDSAAQKVWAVQQAFADSLESMLVSGVSDAARSWGLGDVKGARVKLAEDYSGVVAPEDAYAGLVNAIGKIAEAFEDKGDGASDLYIAPRFMRKLNSINNIAAGGDFEGAKLRQLLGNLFDQTGIRRFVAAPALNKFGDNKHDAMVLCNLDGDRGLHQVSAMTLAPIRTADSLLGSETLYAMRTGLLDIGESATFGLITVKVA